MRTVPDDDLAEAWAAVHEATPRTWFVGRPTYDERRDEWSLYAFDASERPMVGHREREWVAVATFEQIERPVARPCAPLQSRTMQGSLSMQPLDDDEHMSNIIRYELERVPALFDHLQQIIQQGPARGSAALREQRRKFGYLIWTLAAQRCAMGIDALLSWKLLRVDGQIQPMAAHLTLCRSASEAAVTARWLLDVSRDQRAGAAWLHLEDFGWRDKFFDCFRLPGARPGRALALRTKVLAAGIKPTGMTMTQRMEGYAKVIVRQQLTGGTFHNLLSGFTHAQEWSVIAAQRAMESPARGVLGAKTFQATADPILAAAATMLAVDTMNEAIKELGVYSNA